MTAITCATGVILALIIVICVVIYIGRKRGKIFCNKHVQKGKKKNYINVTGIFFYQWNSNQMAFFHTIRIKMFLFIVDYGESNETKVESMELNSRTHENHHEV